MSCCHRIVEVSLKYMTDFIVVNLSNENDK